MRSLKPDDDDDDDEEVVVVVVVVVFVVEGGGSKLGSAWTVVDMDMDMAWAATRRGSLRNFMAGVVVVSWVGDKSNRNSIYLFDWGAWVITRSLELIFGGGKGSSLLITGLC